MREISARRLWTARALALSADTVEWVFLPLFGEGLASPAADALDVLMCGLMTWLVGWHLAFAPTLVVKLLPVVDLAPCWTLAVFIATRRTKENG